MTSGTEPGLRFAVLGPVRAWRDDQPIPPGSPQQRALLAALLLRRGRPATPSELLSAVWGDDPPATALAALRSYAFRLRKALGADSLTTVDGGYALHPGPGFDLALAEQYTAEAEQARGAADLNKARANLVRALALWDGEPLAGLPGPYAETQRTWLAEWRVQLAETRLDLDLQVGCHAEAVSELTALSAEHPLRERLRALLMLALYRSGRQAEALGVYADTRRLLGEELGVDPGAELRDLHQRILEVDPDLLIPPAPQTESVSEPVHPAQLPATVPDFTGRDAFATELSEQLALAADGGPAPAPARPAIAGTQGTQRGLVGRQRTPGAGVSGGIMSVSAVAGIGGVGKTTLAVHVAHAACDAFPDGQLYVDLQGTDARPAEPETVLASFLRALGVADSAIPDSLADRSALYRSTLAGRRVLALLDNAYDAAQVRHLLPGTPGCAALITSRVRMVDLAGAHLVDLDVMSPEEALQLFTRIVGEERVTSERQAALDVVAACGFLPLAIRIAASRLATRRTWTVSFLAGKLADERRRLDELKAGDLAVKATFELGYGHLDPAQARAFRLLALPDGPDISLYAAAAVLDMDPYDAEELLEGLVDISLIESAAPARYRFHDLLRLFARDCAERHETSESRCAALSRLLNFYLASASAVYELGNPGDRMLDHLAPVSRSGLSFASSDKALEWLFSEAPGLLGAVQQAASGGCDGPLHHAADLLLVMQDLMESGIYTRQSERVTRAVVTAATDCGHVLAEGRARTFLAMLLNISGRFAEAEAEAQRALSLGQAAQDPLTCAYAPNLRGIFAHKGHRFRESAQFHSEALEAFRADGNKHGEAAALSNLSRPQLELGDTAAAVLTTEQVVAIYRDLGAGFRLGNGLYAMGIALTATDRLDEAQSCLTEALGIFREARQRFWEGMTLYRLAKVHLAAGRWRESASLAEQAVVIISETGGEWRKANALTVLGHALTGIGQSLRARACWQDALSVFTALGSPETDEVRRFIGDGPSSAIAV
ncbi:AfsR/SARP family transcriptional regulator [Actinacidiphila oryziradicis]|uniref:Tetratricopeptide repeat protein n=1 Tax=Actinacidiphila oryziradicis TaxID=2571141 RepID=A0A4U0SJC4_9ACTN|nr:BTAD domain-containing putative transcriptional regulator [Actinacidiphila oryziradicis]TKA09900.1 tetratricopeptide repeat protein [Actinacidiphila oryziradicis]